MAAVYCVRYLRLNRAITRISPTCLSPGGHGDGTGSLPSLFLFQVLRQAQFRGKRPHTRTHQHTKTREIVVDTSYVSLAYVTLTFSAAMLFSHSPYTRRDIYVCV